MKKLRRILVWLALATLGAGCGVRRTCGICTVHPPRPLIMIGKTAPRVPVVPKVHR